jgi:CheY-like chemotaxis protein
VFAALAIALRTRLLEKRGHRVIVAPNGREALEALEKASYDLVLMDVQMPEMDGISDRQDPRERKTHWRTSTGGRFDRSRNEGIRSNVSPLEWMAS